MTARAVPTAVPLRPPDGAEPRSGNPGRIRPWLVFSIAVVVAFFGLIYSRISLDRTAFVLDELEAQIAEQESRHWELRFEVARLQSPDRLAELAADMGLVYPTVRSALRVEGIGPDPLGPQYRWGELRAVLSAQP